jgi:hypothetical protein
MVKERITLIGERENFFEVEERCNSDGGEDDLCDGAERQQ